MKELNKASKEIENILLILTIVYILSIFLENCQKEISWVIDFLLKEIIKLADPNDTILTFILIILYIFKKFYS